MANVIFALSCLLIAMAGSARADDLDELLARHDTWRGGSAFHDLKSFRAEGALKAMGLRGTATTIETAAGDSYVDVDLGLVRQIQAVSADSGWMRTPSGQIETMPAEDVNEGRGETLLDFPAAFDRASGVHLSLRPDETVDGSTWRVLHVDFGGPHGFDVFLDPATGAQHGYRKTQQQETLFVRQSDWRVVDGVRVPFQVDTIAPVAEENMSLIVSSATINQNPPPRWLDRPVAARKVTVANDARRTAWIPFDLADSGHILIPAEVNGVATGLLLDSGASTAAVDQDFAASARIEPAGAVSVKGTDGQDTAALAGGVQVRLGELTVKDLTVAVLPLHALSAAGGEAIDIVMGTEFLNEMVVDIDFENRRIAFERPEGYVPPKGAHAVELQTTSDGLRTVEASLNGEPPVPMLFDLGNRNAVIVNSSYWKPRRLDQRHRSSVAYIGGIGGMSVVPEIIVDSLQIGGLVLRAVPAELGSERQNTQGSELTMANVGLDLWSRFRLIMDYSQERLYLIGNARSFDAPFRKDRDGFALERTRDGLIVRGIATLAPAARQAWRIGDRITSVDGVNATPAAASRWRHQPAGTVIELAGVAVDGRPFTRKLKLEDFY